MELKLLNLAITLLAELAYAYAFREAYERQAATLRSRFWKSLGVGFVVVAAWLLLGYEAFFLAAAHGSPGLLIVLTVPLYLALAAGGAVSLGALASRLLGWRLEERPFLCIAAGQAVALLAIAVPKIGPALTALYGCSGVGAVALAELGARRADEEAPRLGLAGAASMLILTVALSLGLWLARSGLKSEAAGFAQPQPASAWSTPSPR